MSSAVTIDNTAAPCHLPHQAAGRFQNPSGGGAPGFRQGLRILWRMLRDKSPQAKPSRPIPILSLRREALEQAPDDSLWRLGHSSVLLKLQGKFWLLDPVFAERASPLRWIGPKRFHPVPIELADLPPIEAVILSHDHYDHLDRDTLLALAPRVERFVAPLGVGAHLQRWGIAPAQIRQLGWWQSIDLGQVQLTATPAQHFSGRGWRDGNRTLWASWAIRTPTCRVFFSGDSGYFTGFAEIGRRLGPFDLTLLENGAYDRAWPAIHMSPAQTAQAHLDLRGRGLLPIHNSTFDLAMHAWSEPLEQIAALAVQHGIALHTPRIGERLALLQPAATTRWWVPAVAQAQG